MGTIDEQLRELKSNIQKISPPPELEAELRLALNRPPHNQKKTRWIAAAIVIFLLFGYSWDVLAFYSKKVLGYEQVTTGSVKELLNLGRGQQINKSVRFTDGVTVTFDHLLMDGKGLTILVKCEYPNGHPQAPEDTMQFELKGILRYVNGGGSGEIKDHTVYWVRSFDEEPMLLEKKMELLAQRTVNGRMETVMIPFILNRSQAFVPTGACKKIGQRIDSPYGTIYFDSIQVSALSTVVSGRIINAGQLTPRQNDQNIRLKFSVYNGNIKLSAEGSSLGSSNDRDFTFSSKYAGIESVDELKINDISFEEYRQNSKEIILVPGMESVELGALSGAAALEQVSVKNGSTAAVIRLPRNNTADIGFFRNGTQQKVEVTREQDGSFSRLEYLIPGQGITMEIKGITIIHPLPGTIVIK